MTRGVALHSGFVEDLQVGSRRVWLSCSPIPAGSVDSNYNYTDEQLRRRVGNQEEEVTEQSMRLGE